MEENRKRSYNGIRNPRLEDIPELIHHIQSLLPVKESARTCILSKSWLHAWSTIPTLRFPRQPVLLEREIKYHNLIEATLLRYHTDRIPIQSFDLQFDVTKEESASLVDKWIRGITSKSCLKELSVSIWNYIPTFTLPDEIFSGVNLDTLNVTANGMANLFPIYNTNHPVIKCVSLRVLNLQNVNISDDVFHSLLSTCRLLEKVNLYCCDGLKTINLKNLPCLREFEIYSLEEEDILEISDVPNLIQFHYISLSPKPLPLNMNSLGSVTQLYLGGVFMDNAFFNMIKSTFPFLQSLTLGIGSAVPENLVITSVSIKRLSLAYS